MEANASSASDINSIMIDDVVNWVFRTTLSQKPPVEPFRPSEKSELIGGIGDWTEGLVGPIVLPWRLEAVSLDDIGLCFYDIGPVYTKHLKGLESATPHIPLQNSQWNHRLICRSTAESPESVPTLTEDCSRNSDSIAISEHLLNPDEFPSLRPWHAAEVHQQKPPLSPQLGCVGAGFATELDQFARIIEFNFETDGRAITTDRKSSLQEAFDPEGSSADVDFELLTLDSTVSESGSSDSESIWMSDYSEAVPVLDYGHPFHLVKATVVREGLLAFYASQQRPHGSTVNTAAGSTSTATNSGKSATSTGKKRNNRKRGSSEERESEDDQEVPEKKSRASKKAFGHQVSFACPFAKKDPLKYRGCYAYVLSRIRDVKQHLSRYHQLPIYCPRCMCTFETEDERDEHIRSSSCVVQDTVSYEGVTRAQKVQLTQRVSSKMTLEDQWFTIFDILFPGHTPRPRSAYINVELTVELEGFQDLMYAEGPNIILTAIRSRGIHVATMENEERDLSALLQSAIEEGLQLIAQRWSANTIPDPNASRAAAAAGSSSSRVSHAIEGSEPSQSSSGTLVEDSLQANPAAGHDHQVDNHNPNQHYDDGDQVLDTEPLQGPSAWQDMDVDTARFGGTARPDAAPSAADPGDLEHMFDANMGGGSDIWKRISQGDFFEVNNYGTTESAAQMLEDSREYQSQFDEGRDM
jgi:hypothetical protein